MAAFSDEQFLELMKTLKDNGKEKVAAPPGLVEAKTDQSRINAKHMRAATFDGTKLAFDEWSFSFKRGIRSMNKRAYDMLVKFESKEKDNAESEEFLDDEDEKRSAEIYDVLCQYCSGDALMIVRSVTDCEGYRAWQRLHRKFNPRTMARGLRLLSEAISPAVAKDLAGVEQAIVQWEEKLKKLNSQFGEKITPFMKIAILTSIVPASLQEYVYTHIDEKLDYEDMKEKIKAMTGHKLDSMKPIPADMGNVLDEWWDEADAEEIDAVGADTQCFRCQGWGHTSKACPTPKGLGKGKGPTHGKSSGKGIGMKGKGMNGMKGGKGVKGKGFSGVCWICGKAGHKAAECPSQAQTNAIDADSQETAEIGGVWIIGAVDHMIEPRNSGQKEPSTTGSITGLPARRSLPPQVPSQASSSSSTSRDWLLHPGIHKRSLKENKTAAKGTGIQKIDRNDSSCEKIPEKTTKDAQERGKDFSMSNVANFKFPMRTKRNLSNDSRISNVGSTGKGLNKFFPFDFDPHGQEINIGTSGSRLVGSSVDYPDDGQAINLKVPQTFKKDLTLKNRFVHLSINDEATEKEEDDEDVVEVCAVAQESHAPRRTRASAMKFHVANVSKPLAAAGKVVEAGNRVVLDQHSSYVEHIATGERMHLRKEKGVYVFDVEFEDGDKSTITLDSGAGVNVWPRGLKDNIPMEAKDEHLRMFAANGTRIEHDGTKQVRFKGIASPFQRQSW
jgi:hypothetical protein